jgi:hypothetical protein
MARALTHRASPAPVPVELLMLLLVESGVGESGGPGGHEGARRFREEQQRRVEQGGAESGIDDADADRDFRWRSRRVTPDCCCAVAAVIGRGWKDGECQIAKKVDPNRSAKMADQIKAMMSALTVMEYDLRKASAAADLLQGML